MTGSPGTVFRVLNSALLGRLAKDRARRVAWWRIARELNRERIWVVLQEKPWTAARLRKWHHRHGQPVDRAHQRAQRLRMYRRVGMLYMVHRDQPDRVKRVLGELRQEFGNTPAGGTISSQWVSGVAAQLGIRVAAERKHWQGNVRRRPRVRADCDEGPRPCPWITCRHHMARDILASARRKYRAAGTRPRESDHYQVPPEWGEAIAAGDFSVLPHTCILDLVEDQGMADERGAMYAAIADGSAIGRHLGITRELVRLDTVAAIRTVGSVDPEVGEFLQRGYDESKLKPRE